METKPSSTNSWTKRLDQALLQVSKRRPETGRPVRVAVLGIGNELRGDDAAGVLVARGLRNTHSSAFILSVMDAGAAPESFTGAVRRCQPDLVIMVDAAVMGELPGTVRWLDWRETSGLSATTHTLPPYVIAGYLAAELGCEVALLAIQPEAMDFDGRVSPAAERAVEEIIAGFTRAFGGEVAHG